MKPELWKKRFAEHLELHGRSPETIESYSYELVRFLGFLEDRGLSGVHELCADEVLAYQVALHSHRKANGQPLSAGTRNARMAGVLAFLAFLTEARYLLVNPGQDVHLKRHPERLLPELPDEEQVLRLLEIPDTTTPLGLRDRAMLELLYSSGLRSAELRKLAVEDVDTERLWVRVLHGKGGKQRMVPLGEPAAAWTQEYLRSARGFLVRDSSVQGERGHLFLSSWGTPVTRKALSRVVRLAAEAAGLGRVTPHTLRHCCASHMLARQARLRYLQELLGHSKADTTQRYTRVQLEDLRETHRRCHPREAL